MLQKLRERMGRDEGFTLVELLVVMLILGLLAAIAIPSFFNQRDKARDADAKANVRTAQTAMETYATDNGGDYADATATILDGIENTIDHGVLTVTPGTPAGGYTILGTSPTGSTFSIVRDDVGNVTYPCSTGGQKGCPNGGSWGG